MSELNSISAKPVLSSIPGAAGTSTPSSKNAYSLRYAKLFLELVEEQGWDTKPCVDEMELNFAGIDKVDRFLSHEQRHQLIAHFPGFFDIPGVGLKLGRKLNISTNGILTYAVMSSGSYLEGLEIFKRYTQINEQLISMTLGHEGDDIIVGFKLIDSALNPVLDAEEGNSLIRYGFECALGGAYTFIQEFLGCNDFISSVRFSYGAPKHLDLYQEFFGVEPLFESKENALCIPKQLLERKTRTANASISTVVLQQCDTLLKNLNKSNSLSKQIFEFLMTTPTHIPSQNETARRLCMSDRTLRRRLSQENITYKDIVDSVHKTLAVRFLTETDWPVQKIADFLGYSETTNFNRAFKRWTNNTPARYRRFHKEEQLEAG